jgi:hypothetical protein
MGLGIKYVILANHLVSLITSSTTNPWCLTHMVCCKDMNKKIFGIKAFITFDCWLGVFDTTLCDKVCQQQVGGFPMLFSSTNKIDGCYITEILLKVALNTILL